MPSLMETINADKANIDLTKLEPPLNEMPEGSRVIGPLDEDDLRMYGVIRQYIDEYNKAIDDVAKKLINLNKAEMMECMMSALAYFKPLLFKKVAAHTIFWNSLNFKYADSLEKDDGDCFLSKDFQLCAVKRKMGTSIFDIFFKRS